MDKDASEGEEPEKYLWLAALIIGILLILMLLAIAGIAIWKYFKKEDTTDQNWAGPSPLADGNIHEDIKINECILGRHRSLSSISTAPIVLNEVQEPQKGHVNESMHQEHSEDGSTQEEDDSKTNMPTLPYISRETTCFSSDASEGQQSKQHPQGHSLNDEISLPPPPDDFLHIPMPPQIEELLVTKERNMQPLPLTEVTPSDEHGHQMSLYQANTISTTDSVDTTCDLEHQLLPPPPADL